MKTFKGLANILGFLLLLSLLSCNFSRSKEASGGGDSARALEDILNSDETASYSVIQNSIINKRCTKCHAPGLKAANIPLTNYTEVKLLVNPGQPNNSLLFARLKNNGGNMPQGDPALPEIEVQILRDWIFAGAHEEAQPKPNSGSDSETISSTTTTSTTLAGPPPTTPQPVRFNDVFQSVFSNHCIMCHKEGGKAQDYPLTDYDSVMHNFLDPKFVVPSAPQESSVYIAISTGKMPSKRAVAAGEVKPLTAEQIELVRQWILQGAQN